MFNFPVPLLHTRQFPVAVQFVTFMTDPCEGAKVDWEDAPMTFPFWIVTVVPESDLMELELRCLNVSPAKSNVMLFFIWM
jgi:hypothetical protein